MNSTRLIFAIVAMIGSFILMGLAMILDIDPTVAQQVVESCGWLLTSVGTGYLGTKAVEHGVKHLGKKQDV